jgi:hypothetical protein
MQEARDLSLPLRSLREVSEGRGVFEELPLDLGRESAPSHDDSSPQTSQNLFVVVESRINLLGRRHSRYLLGASVSRCLCVRFVCEGHGSATLVIPPGDGGGVVPRIGLRSFNCGH